MSPNAFTGQPKRPTDAELAAALGKAKALWDKLVTELISEHGLKSEWKSYSVKMGWGFRLKRKRRNIVHFGPRRDGFQAALIFGDKAMAEVRKAKWPQRIRMILNKAPRYPEGTGVRLEIKTARDIAAVTRLAGIKLAN
jgi:hypothetical protein